MNDSMLALFRCMLGDVDPRSPITKEILGIIPQSMMPESMDGVQTMWDLFSLWMKKLKGEFTGACEKILGMPVHKAGLNTKLISLDNITIQNIKEISALMNGGETLDASNITVQNFMNITLTFLYKTRVQEDMVLLPVFMEYMQQA